MANLLQEIQAIVQQVDHASQPADYLVGTVTSEDPLQIVTDTSQAPLNASVLHLTSAVVEKKIRLSHTHEIYDTYTGGGSASTALDDVHCIENGEDLPIEDGYVILNKKLEVGDRVILLRVQHGQQFIVLSRVFEGS